MRSQHGSTKQCSVESEPKKTLSSGVFNIGRKELGFISPTDIMKINSMETMNSGRQISAHLPIFLKPLDEAYIAKKKNGMKTISD